jgi:hypothetical protein
MDIKRTTLLSRMKKLGIAQSIMTAHPPGPAGPSPWAPPSPNCSLYS